MATPELARFLKQLIQRFNPLFNLGCACLECAALVLQDLDEILGPLVHELPELDGATQSLFISGGSFTSVESVYPFMQGNIVCLGFVITITFPIMDGTRCFGNIGIL